jgi:tight adherence protein C
MTLTNADMPLIFSMLSFITLLLFFWGIFQHFLRHSQKAKLKEKIAQSDHNDSLPDTVSLAADAAGTDRPIASFLNFLGKRVVKENSIDYSAMRVKFLNAGIRLYNAPTIFWGVKILLATVLAVGFFLIRISAFKLVDPLATVALCIFLFLLGLYMPSIWLRFKIAERKNKLTEGLPDALDLLVICVEAGMGLDSAIQRVSEEIKMANIPLSDELRLYNLEVRAGKSRHEALRNLSTRTDLEDINSLVTLLIQTDQFGTSIAQTLRVYSDTFRTRRYQKAEEIAARLPVKLVLPTAMFIFPSLFVVILGPAFIRIFRVLTSI